MPTKNMKVKITMEGEILTNTSFFEDVSDIVINIADLGDFAKLSR
jgi:hypothetical protein